MAKLNVIVDLCVIPIGSGVSVSNEIAEVQKILRGSGLHTQMHAYGTNIEGEWDDVMRVIKKCHETLHAQGVARISSSLKIGTRTDKVQSMKDKITAVESKLS